MVTRTDEPLHVSEDELCRALAIVEDELERSGVPHAIKVREWMGARQILGVRQGRRFQGVAEVGVRWGEAERVREEFRHGGVRRALHRRRRHPDAQRAVRLQWPDFVARSPWCDPHQEQAHAGLHLTQPGAGLRRRFSQSVTIRNAP